MREIKFRIVYSRNGVIVIKHYTLVAGKSDYINEWKSAGYEIIGQDLSTGLKDKNGKEIYEGDILETESGICEVKWYGKGACFRWMFTGNSESPLNYDDIEVIGNIYEHGELLK